MKLHASVRDGQPQGSAMYVVYHPDMNAPRQGASPSAAKPQCVAKAWRERFPSLQWIDPVPVTREDLALAHDRAFVDRVLDLRIENGFGTRSEAVARSLPWTAGAMVRAARLAVNESGMVAAPVSGFHHACWDEAGGYCTFNGLMVAAMLLRRDGMARHVGILDYDMHYGNGTDDIIRRLSVNWVTHITAGAQYRYREHAGAFMENIPRNLDKLASCDVVLYQAGADPHVDDPLGGMLDTEQMRQRDALVFRTLRHRGTPVAWNLAGGYQEPIGKVVDLHVNSMRECLRALDEILMT
jgi:acetoin utilization deacetylase AcuC-like enzyme